MMKKNIHKDNTSATVPSLSFLFLSSPSPKEISQKKKTLG